VVIANGKHIHRQGGQKLRQLPIARTFNAPKSIPMIFELNKKNQ